MRVSVVFVALLGLVAAQSAGPRLHPGIGAGEQSVPAKQQDVIWLLENIAGELAHQPLREIGENWEFEPNLQHFENPSTVKYYVGLVYTGHAQPIDTPFSLSVSQLRKECALLQQVFMGAKDYQTFIRAAAWARVHVNKEQFVKAFASAVMQRPDMQGVILPPAYEVFPHYFFDTRIIQKVHDYILRHGGEHGWMGMHDEKMTIAGGAPVHYVRVNYTSHLPNAENKIAYLTDDIGLNAYYSYVVMASYMIPYGQHWQQQQQPHEHPAHTGGMHGAKNGHGAMYYYLHRQLLARYNLERLGQGLEPIHQLDDSWTHIETPFSPQLRYLNGASMPGREHHLEITPSHHHYELSKMVRALERRILDAIDSGYVITPQGQLLGIYQPEGLNILGELIEGTGRSVNPRYYGAFAAVAKQLLGNVPEWHNVYEYMPAGLELGQTAIRDPAFWQLYAKIVEMFHYYQEALPAYQYNDLLVPGVKIDKVDVGELVTYFDDFEVDLNNAMPQPVHMMQGQHHQQPYPVVKAIMKRLDHKPYEYTIHVSAQKPVQGAVVRVFVGPKYNYNGQMIDINVHRHYFYELDQFVYDLMPGHNAIVRNSHQAPGHSADWPSVQQIKHKLEGATQSYNIVRPEQLYGFPARLSLPKGSHSGFPLQWLVVITAGMEHQPEHYGPVVEEEWMTYQPQHYQILAEDEYQQFVSQHPMDKMHAGYQTVDVVPEYENHIVTEGNWHWGYLYKKYPGSYYYPHWQQSTPGMEPHQQWPQWHHHQQPEHQQHYEGKPSMLHHQQLPWQPMPEHMQQPHMYQHMDTGKGLYQNAYKQDMFHADWTPEPIAARWWKQQQPMHGGEHKWQTGYPTGTLQGHQMHQMPQMHDDYLHRYYENKFIGDVVGGVVSFDNKPFGFPLDRQLAHSAFYVPNMYVKDVLVYHQDEPVHQF